MKTKYCPTCKQEKSTDEFHKNKARYDGIASQCKICKNKETLQRERLNFEHKKERSQRYYIENKDILSERKKKYYLENKDKIDNRNKDWAKKNKKRITSYLEKHYQENKERYYINSKLYKATEKGKAVMKNTYAKRRIAKTLAKVCVNEIVKLVSTYKNCYWCGCELNGKYHLDHYIPLSKGGEHSIANFVVSCPTCNFKKNSKDPYQFANSLGRIL